MAVARAAAALVVLSRSHSGGWAGVAGTECNSAQPAGAESASKTTATTAAGGTLLGLAIATKVTPVLLLPALVRRRPLLVLATVIGTVAAAYAPHLLAVGPDVIGYLPGYVQEEGYASGSRFGLLTLLVPDRWAGVLAVVVLAAVAVAVARTSDPDRPWLGGATMTGAALLVATPAYAWYALLLVMLVGLGARTVWLGVVAAGYLANYAVLLHVDGQLAQRVGYGLALAALVVTFVIRRRRQRSGS